MKFVFIIGILIRSYTVEIGWDEGPRFEVGREAFDGIGVKIFVGKPMYDEDMPD